jgi:hypothetical protein
MPKRDRPRCRQCRRVGEPEEIQAWGRRRNGWLKQLCPQCDAQRIAKHQCQRCGASAANRPDWGKYGESEILKPFCPECYAAGRVKPITGKHCCKRCGRLAAGCPEWRRYENNGRLKALCPDCDANWIARKEEERRRNEAARGAGFSRGWSSTPEAHRIQRERDAAKQGRVLEPYVPQAERNWHGRMLDAERLADRIRSWWAREWLRPFRDQLENELYWTDTAYREAAKARWRVRHAKQREREVARVLAYKRTNSERNAEWTQTRLARERHAADGTVTPEAIAQLKREASNCAYCGCGLDEKQTDHMIPLVLGGEHSLRNIVIVCPQCNGKKARLSYEEWVDRIDAQHRERVLALYCERYAGALAA